MFMQSPDVAVVYGDANWINENGAVIRRYPTIPFDSRALAHDCFISQPAAFFRASAYRECALDESLPVSFDYDLWIRLAMRQRRFRYVPQTLACARMHRGCLTLTRRPQVFEVTIGLLKRHYGYIPLSWIYGYLSYRHDGRDQFFEPLRFSARVFLSSVLRGFVWNRNRPLRALREAASMACCGLWRHLARLPITFGIAHRDRAGLPTERPASRTAETQRRV
jgi:hypothetical protein